MRKAQRSRSRREATESVEGTEAQVHDTVLAPWLEHSAGTVRFKAF